MASLDVWLSLGVGMRLGVGSSLKGDWARCEPRISQKSKHFKQNTVVTISIKSHLEGCQQTGKWV